MQKHKTGFKKYITDEEFNLYKKELENIFNPSLKMALKLLCLGLRIGEVVELKRSNFNSNFSVVTYTLEKSHIIHTRQIPKELAFELKQFNFIYSNSRKKWSTSYFFFPWGRKVPAIPNHLTRSTIRSWFQRFRKKYGLDQPYYICKDGKGLRRISPHTLRHRAAYKIFKATQNNIIATRDIIGHKMAKTTYAYCFAWDARENEAVLIESAGII